MNFLNKSKIESYLYKLILFRYQLIQGSGKMHTLKLTKNEFVEEKGNKIKRYPNLNTVLMVEKFLEKNRDVPMPLAELRKNLPRQVMYPTLKIILEYLWKSGKIVYGPRGVQWIYSKPEHIKKMMDGAVEV